MDPRRPFCAKGHAEDCFDVLVRIGVPRLSGDSATVWLYVIEEVENGAALEESDTLYQIVRDNGNWRVDRPLDSRRTYFVLPSH